MKGVKQVTMCELKQCECDFVHIKDIAPILGCNPQSIRTASQSEEGRKALGFAVTRIGARTLIPRLAFIKYVEGVGCYE